MFRKGQRYSNITASLVPMKTVALIWLLLSISHHAAVLVSFLPSSCSNRKVLRCSKQKILTNGENQPFHYDTHTRRTLLGSNGRGVDTSCDKPSNRTRSRDAGEILTITHDDITGRKHILRIVEELGHLRGPLSPRRRIEDPGGGQYTSRLYQYIMRARLQVDNVQQVLQFLNTLFPTNPETISEILTVHPRILRRSVEYQLQPVVKFLRNLYGEQLFCESLRRNPSLLLVSGVGFFNSRQHDNSLSVQRFLQEELNMPRYLFDQMKERHPFILHIPLDRTIRPFVSFLACLLTQQDYDQSKREHSPTLLLHSLDDTIKKVIIRVISNYPTILSLTLDGNLYPTVEFLQNSCFMDESNLANMVRNCPQILGLSVEDNLNITLDYIVRSVGLNTPKDFQRCFGRHPQILCLSLENLHSKVVFLHSLEYNDEKNKDHSGEGVQVISKQSPAIGSNPTDVSLLYRIAVNAPSVYSLSLRDNVIPKLITLAKVWCPDLPRISLEQSLETWKNYPVSGTMTHISLPQQARITLTKRIKEYPAILTFSHDAKILPTLQFLNRTGYLNLDASGYAQDTTGNSVQHHPYAIPGRYLAASLYTRLLPRWHYIQNQRQQLLNNTCLDKTKNKPDAVFQSKVFEHPPLHILTISTDLQFCSYFNFTATSFHLYREDAIPKLKFTAQFENWIRTGAPIDIIG